jgi:hypothetical protein
MVISFVPLHHVGLNPQKASTPIAPARRKTAMAGIARVFAPEACDEDAGGVDTADLEADDPDFTAEATETV